MLGSAPAGPLSGLLLGRMWAAKPLVRTMIIEQARLNDEILNIINTYCRFIECCILSLVKGQEM